MSADLASRIAALAERAEHMLAQSDGGYVYHGDEVDRLAAALRLALRAFKAERLLREAEAKLATMHACEMLGDELSAINDAANVIYAEAEALVGEG